jgi:hypothetical protein
MANEEARERERLRKAAQESICPICGRQEVSDAQKDVREYAKANARLLARIAQLEMNTNG